MVDIRSLAAPKVAIAVAGVLVLVVVTTLVVVFYVRNPDVTDAIFNPGKTEGTTSATISIQGDIDSGSSFVTTTVSSSGSSSSSFSSNQHPADAINSQTTPRADNAKTTTVTPAPQQFTTLLHAIEPVEHV